MVHARSLARSVEPEAGPGSGHRRTPVQLGDQYEPRSMPPGPCERFDYHTTEECWRITPLLLRASMPLHPEVLDQEQAASTVLREEHEAPVSGHRRRPAPTDEAGLVHGQVLPVPSALLRTQVIARHSPESLVAIRRHSA